jgi:hypothetical protein
MPVSTCCRFSSTSSSADERLRKPTTEHTRIAEPERTFSVNSLPSVVSTLAQLRGTSRYEMSLLRRSPVSHSLIKTARRSAVSGGAVNR